MRLPKTIKKLFERKPVRDWRDEDQNPAEWDLAEYMI